MLRFVQTMCVYYREKTFHSYGVSRGADDEFYKHLTPNGV